MKASIIFVDVDDTLVRSIGAKRIPIPQTVEAIRTLHEAGSTLYLWSSGGGQYARETAVELGIEACFVAFLPKPHVLIDDQTVEEWRGLTVLHPSQDLLSILLGDIGRA